MNKIIVLLGVVASLTIAAIKAYKSQFHKVGLLGKITNLVVLAVVLFIVIRRLLASGILNSKPKLQADSAKADSAQSA
jgi:capsule polysaccharide export protein KpsE/RkpR